MVRVREGARFAALIVIASAVACSADYERWWPKSSAESLKEIAKAAPYEQASVVDRVEKDEELSRARSEVPKQDDLPCSRLFPLTVFNRFRIRGVNDLPVHVTPALVARTNEQNVSAMYGDERNAIRAAGRRPAIGLALSGGGIRSASFSSGVLLALHELGVLDRVGYLSTVSGGGYVGAWYMIHNDVPDAELFEIGGMHQHHLGQNGNFLTASHYSESRLEFAGNLAENTALVPIHWGLNGVLDLDVNTWGIRDDYRRGIARAFMYETPLLLGPIAPRAKKSMRFLLPSGVVHRPFWIVNAHLAMNGDSQSFRGRSGDAFEITPLRGGADSVGYVEIEDVGELERRFDSDRFWMTPLYAVAASGAAADSSSLRVPWVVDMSLQALNLDLGYYIDGWARGFVRGDRWWWMHEGLHDLTSPFPVYSVLGWFASFWSSDGACDIPWLHGHDQVLEARKYYLTDGGHFDNTGVYALVRRGCRKIIVSDATFDPAVSEWDSGDPNVRAKAFEDLHELERKLFADFGAELRLDWSGFEERRPVLRGRIENLPIGDDDTPVEIIWIKAATHVSDHPRETSSYIDEFSANDSAFPHDSTFESFFSEKQLLAYRALGREIVLNYWDDQARKGAKLP